MVFKVCKSKARPSPLDVFALWPHGADVANTVPNLFPTSAREGACKGLIMGDGLTRGSGRRRINRANPVPGDMWATPARPFKLGGQDRMEE